MNRPSKIIALILAVIMTLLVAPVAFAQDNTVPAPSSANVSVSIVEAKNIGGQMRIMLTVDNNSEYALTLTNIRTTDPSMLTSCTLPDNQKSAFRVPSGSKNSFVMLCDIAKSATRHYTELFTFTFEYDRIQWVGITNSPKIEINLPYTLDLGEDLERSGAAFMLGAKDENGKIVSIPKGGAGEKVKVHIPLLCERGGNYEISLAPVMSTSAEDYPFEISRLDYTIRKTVQLNENAVVSFAYDILRLRDDVSRGLKVVMFKATYRSLTDADDKGEVSIPVYVDVTSGKAGGAEKDSVLSQPKLILQTYALPASSIYAGESFELDFTLLNTSKTEDIKNITIALKADSDKLMPANGSSNTIYIEKIGKGETHSEKLAFQSAPDTEARSYTLSLSIAYDGETAVGHSAMETIAIPILQKIRINLTEPLIDSDIWINQSFSASFQLNNKGRATLYNCEVIVDADGVVLEDGSFYQGNIAPGNTMRADLYMIAQAAGAISGNIVVKYEDSLNNPFEEKIPFDIFVNESVPEMSIGESGGGVLNSEAGVDIMIPINKPFPWGDVGFGAGALVLVVLAIVFIIRFKKKRALREDV